MSYLLQAVAIVLEVLFGLLAGLFVLRALLQWARANVYDPISQFCYRLTNPVLMPLRRWLPQWRTFDLAAVVVALLLGMLKVWLLAALGGVLLGPLPTTVLGLAALLDLVLYLYFWLIVARVLASFFTPDRNHPVLPLLVRLTEPVLAPLRRRLPAPGPLDLSPLVASVAIVLAQVLLLAPLQDLGTQLARGG